MTNYDKLGTISILCKTRLNIGQDWAIISIVNQTRDPKFVQGQSRDWANREFVPNIYYMANYSVNSASITWMKSAHIIKRTVEVKCTEHS